MILHFDLILLELGVVCGWLAAFQVSRGLAYLSTGWNVGGLNCRVRNGTGCAPPLWPPKPPHVTVKLVMARGLLVL